MTQAQFQAAARYWEEKDAASVKLDPAQLRSVAEAYIQANNTCALATGAGAYVRCTPIEYSFHDGAFWMFSEGGKKFIGLSENPNVCLAIFDGYTGVSKPAWDAGHGQGRDRGALFPGLFGPCGL